MDLYNHNANKKRKLSQSKEYEGNLKRKDIKITDCFRRCYTRKKQDMIPIKEKILKASTEKILLQNKNINQQLRPILSIQSISIEKISNIPMIHLKRSPLYNESTFCRKASEVYHDPCIECTVQYGPDTWENIPKNFQNSNKQLYHNNKSMSIERFDTFRDKKISNDDLGNSSAKEKSTNKALNLLKNDVNSFINNIIGDGVDRVSEIITTMSTYHNGQKEFKIENKLSTNSENNCQQNESKRRPFELETGKQNLDFIKQQQQYPGLVFEKQNLKKSSQISHQSSIELSLDNTSSQIIIPDDYNWNLVSNETNFDQHNAVDKRNLSQDQEPYNWDYQEYQWLSPINLSQKNHLVDEFMNDQSKQSIINDKDTFVSNDDSTDLSYSIASVLPPNKIKKVQSRTNDLKNSSLSLNILNQQQTFSTPEFNESADQISDYRNKSEHNQQKIDSNEYRELNHTNSNQQQKSFLNLSEGQDLLPTINSTHSSKLNYNKLQVKKSSDIDANNDIPIPSTLSEILHHQETQEQNDRFSGTSVSDLFKQIIHAKKQKSLDLDSISTVYSIPISVRPSASSEVVSNKYDKNHTQSSRMTLTEKHLPVSSNTETKQLDNIISMDAKDQSRPTNINLSTKRTQLHLTDKQTKQPPSTEINNIVHQVRSTYDDIMNSWRHLLERLLNFMLPSIHNTDHNINLSPSNTHSWSTLIPTETLNMTQSDNIGPWWGRRDAYDRTPATFIFANESLSDSYSTEMIISNKQMCISIENRPYCYKYYSCPNACHCCCSSSIIINNSLSSS